MAFIFINVGGYFINPRQPCSVFAQQALSDGQKKHNFEKLKEDFVKNISIFNPMVLFLTYDNCMDCGVHFPKPSFEYLHTVFYVTT